MADDNTYANLTAMDRVPLETASRYYYFKPMAVFFNALHLRAFQTAGLCWKTPVLDIGCSDGSYGLLMAEVLGAPDHILGIDVDEKAISCARTEAKMLYDDMLVASAAQLPFDDNAFEMIIVNASLVSIQPGLEASMREAYRVLKAGGRFYATVCTDAYEKQYWIARLLRGLGLGALARHYMHAMNRRMQQAHLLSWENWIQLFEDNGFRVVQHFGFLPLRLVPLWSFLAWTPLRIIGISKRIPWPWLHKKMAVLWTHVFAGIYTRTESKLDSQKSGYILIEAIKVSPEHSVPIS